ncbi:bacteriocin BlpN [Enterococcus faecalis]|nr:bacteriocin BlpN [Enterococcus faecalis]
MQNTKELNTIQLQQITGGGIKPNEFLNNVKNGVKWGSKFGGVKGAVLGGVLGGVFTPIHVS